jgi:hypothetical protein
LALFGPKQEIGSTQDALRFAEIRDATIVLKEGHLRQILLCSSINFSLKSEQEQNAIIFAYQNFLNSLDFPIQILMQSKKLDLSNYLTKLETRSNEQTNELLRLQTTDYIEFIKRLINLANIMDKRFYVIIPYLVPPKMASRNIPLLGKQDLPQPVLSEEEFNQYKKELEHRVQVIQSGLGSIGIRTALLSTQQIIELIYGVYNPEEASKEKITAAEELQGEVVESEVFRPQAPKAKEDNASAPA